MRLQLLVVAAVAVSFTVSEHSIFDYNPMECAWYGRSGKEWECGESDLLQCPNGTRQVHGRSPDGMRIEASVFGTTSSVYYYAPGFGEACTDNRARIFCCKAGLDPPSEKFVTRDNIPVVNCAWAGFSINGICRDRNCPAGYEQLARTNGLSAEDARLLGYPTSTVKDGSYFNYAPLGFNQPCENLGQVASGKRTRAFCCPTKPQYINPPLDPAAKYANPLTCAWFPRSSVTGIGRCLKISTCPPDYTLLYRSATGKDVDPPHNLDAPGFGGMCEHTLDRLGFYLDFIAEGTKAFCCKTPLQTGRRGIPAVNCGWYGSLCTQGPINKAYFRSGDSPVCSVPKWPFGGKAECFNDRAYEVVAYTEGDNYEDLQKYKYPAFMHNSGEIWPLGFGRPCTIGQKSFCCPLLEATLHRAYHALVIV